MNKSSLVRRGNDLSRWPNAPRMRRMSFPASKIRTTTLQNILGLTRFIKVFYFYISSNDGGRLNPVLRGGINNGL